MSNKRVEIERQWLIDANKIPESFIYFSIRKNILQGYIITDENSELRLRKINSELRLGRIKDEYYLEVKKGMGKIRENPKPIKISKELFNDWLPKIKGNIGKKRYTHSENLPFIELDFYLRELEGLIIAEVEFESEGESDKFIPPKWFGPEVTDDERYKDKNLAVCGLPKDYPFKSQIKNEGVNNG